MEEILLNLELSLSHFFITAPYLVSFLAGILTFISPCVLPMTPAYLSYISGMSINELSHSEKLDTTAKLRILRTSLMFVFGFGVVFVALGVLSDNFIGEALSSSAAKIIGGLIIIVFGLHVMKIIDIKFLNLTAQSQFGGGKNFFAPFILGLSFAIGWSPCVGPILGSIFMLSAQEEGKGAILMTLYAVGLGIPFILSAILTANALQFMNKIKQHFLLIERFAGVLLILIGASIGYSGL